MYKPVLMTLAVACSLCAMTPAQAGQDSLIQELDATPAPVDPNAPPTKSVGDWQVTYFSPRHCTAYRNGGRGDNQAVSVERQNGEYWLYFITDQTSPPGEPATMLIAQFRDFERHGDVREYTVARAGDQRAYGLKLDAATRPYFAGGKFFTLLANLADEAALKGRGDTFFTVGISSALAALDAC